MGKVKVPQNPAGWSLSRECPGCGVPESACRCATPAPPGSAGPPGAKLRLEKRCGKAVTVVFGLTLGEAEAKELLRELKARCSSGGTCKGGELELQGDHREVVKGVLAAKGFRVKGG